MVEILVPVILALVLGLGAFLFLTPVFGRGAQPDPGVIRIYSSVPRPDFDAINHGIQMAVDEAGGRAGQFRIDFVPLNDAVQDADGRWRWNTDVELANARRAVEDPDAMAYIGTYNSGAAKVSIAVLNRVGMTMISPGNTYPGLTKPGGGNAAEPWIYYPLGVRNYFRVLPADDLQGAAGAAYARELGVKSVYVLDDTELYGKGIATIFAQSARDLGMEVLGGPESIDVRASGYQSLAQKIVGLNPDLVYFGGSTPNHPDLVLRDLRSAGYQGRFMGADAITDEVFAGNVEAAGADGMDIYASVVGIPPTELTGPGADWYQRYISRYPNDSAPNFAPFGYEAARVAISAIERAGTKDREAIRRAVAETSTANMGGEHILGEWSFDQNGDTSLVTVSVLHLDRRDGANLSWHYEGAMSYDPATRTWTFRKE
jgi:branched-chain amino acid transport system substrate-binding protein